MNDGKMMKQGDVGKVWLGVGEECVKGLASIRTVPFFHTTTTAVNIQFPWF